MEESSGHPAGGGGAGEKEEDVSFTGLGQKSQGHVLSACSWATECLVTNSKQRQKPRRQKQLRGETAPLLLGERATMKA